MDNYQTIYYSYGTDLSWTKNLAANLNGTINENYISADTALSSGIRYFLDCGDGIVLYYINAVYNTDLRLIEHHNSDDFLVLSYDLILENETDSDKKSVFLNLFSRNLSITDSETISGKIVHKGDRIKKLYIFLRKDKISGFIKKHNSSLLKSNKKKNAVNTSYAFDKSLEFYLNELVDIRIGGLVNDFNLKAMIYFLLSFLYQLIAYNGIFIRKCKESDILKILLMQTDLIRNAEENGLSTKVLAERAGMSEIKFLYLFKNITGISIEAFFK